MFSVGYRASLLLATSAIAWAGNADANETISYSYDSLGRLVRVERSGTVNNGVNAAQPDTPNNRTVQTIQVAGFLCPSDGDRLSGGRVAPRRHPAPLNRSLPPLPTAVSSSAVPK